MDSAMPLPRAYVTLLASDGEDVEGVVGLAKGLRKVQSKYPLVVAVLPDVTKEYRKILRAQGCKVRKIKPVDLTEVREIEPAGLPNNWTQFMTAVDISKYSKLRIWEFVEYGKMVYLESDMQVFANIDNLFDKEGGYLYAVRQCFCESTWRGTPQHEFGYCRHGPKKVRGKDEPDLRLSYFNDGLFVFEPGRTTYNSLINTLESSLPTPFAQQDVLNTHFKNVYKSLPLKYNFALSMLKHHPEVDPMNMKVVHYCEAGSKPWRFPSLPVPDYEQCKDIQRQAKILGYLAVQEDIEMLIDKWWDIHDDHTRDHQNWMGRLRNRLLISLSKFCHVGLRSIGKYILNSE